MKKNEEQLARLSARLKEASRVTLSDTTEWLGVSESTARRLFVKLEQAGQAIRVYGGIARIPDVAGEYSYDLVENRLLAQKKRIASAAVEEILAADHVFLDSGSTVYQVSCALSEAVTSGRDVHVQMFTNSLKNMEALVGTVPVQLVGGQYRDHRRDFCGFLAETVLSQLNFDLCVLGADGVRVDSGLMTTDFDTARLNAQAIARSRRKVVVADASKFKLSALVRYAKIDQIDRIITDTGLGIEDLRAFEAAGVQVDCV